MSISLQTDVTSLIAQQNLNVNTANESNTITQLTSGYRINSSGDDAAGLAISNQYNADIGQLTQGVQNANNGVSTLQIIDGGLSNISQILNRLETLATESASGTFTGNRATLDQEYQQQLGEITRQADNIGLNSGGNFNSNLNVYIGGARLSTASTSGQVNVDLSNSTEMNAVDAGSLNLTGTNVLGGTAGGVGITGNAVRLDNPAVSFLQNSTQTYTFNYTDASGNTQSRNVVASGGGSGINGNAVITQLNNGLGGTGITASINATSGLLNFTSSGAFAIGVATAVGGGISTVTGANTAVNLSQYNLTHAFTAFDGGTNSETFTVSDANHSANVTLSTIANAGTVSAAVNTINAALATAHITDVSALATGDNTGITFQGAANFSVVESAVTAGTGSLFGAVGSKNVTAAAGGGTSGTNAQAALTAINNAVAALGLVQGVVGTGENKLRYAISLAQSQIASFSNAESSIKDVDVAAAASNLSKEQILQQSSVAALVQANAIPQAVLTLLKSA